MEDKNTFALNYYFTADMQDFGQLSSKTVTEVLMLEMKMSPGAKVFLVSGYPRNMRDVVEYAEKVSDPSFISKVNVLQKDCVF